MDSLWHRINNAEDALSKFRSDSGITACIYPRPYQGCSQVVRWFYSRNNGCQVFFACSKEISDKIDSESWADVSYEFTVYVEHELMPYCVENTDWEYCCRRAYDYNQKVPEAEKTELEQSNYSFLNGCQGTICHCEPFGAGDFTYGIAEAREFNLQPIISQ